MTLLPPACYEKALPALDAIPFNTLFARAVIGNGAEGKVYGDNISNPKTFYVVHAYGMSLLFGESGNAGFNSSFRSYVVSKQSNKIGFEWAQAFPNSWDVVLAGLFNDIIATSADNAEKKSKDLVELNTRINFKFNTEKYSKFRKNYVSPFKIVRTDEKLFAEMKGNVVPSYFWKNAEDFWKNGVGYSLLYDDKLASTAYSAFIQGNQLELGIETVEAFRGKGLAAHSCSALIDHCLEHNYEPVWACRLENTGSFKLAEKLGFEPTFKIPYYRI
jgi:hypothetical protein